MSANFSNFDPNAGYARESTTPAHKYSDGCGCLECRMKHAQQAADKALEEQRAGYDDDYCNHLRTATCKCGHVGAECFNDSYCATESEAAIWHRTYRKLHKEYAEYRKDMRAEIESIKEAHKVVSYTAEAWESNFYAAMDMLNDLQADYAEEMTWRDLEQGTDEAELRNRADRIEELETTIRVLSGMVSE